MQGWQPCCACSLAGPCNSASGQAHPLDNTPAQAHGPLDLVGAAALRANQWPGAAIKQSGLTLPGITLLSLTIWRHNHADQELEYFQAQGLGISLRRGFLWLS